MDYNKLYELAQIKRSLIVDQKNDSLIKNKDANFLWPGFVGYNYANSKVAIIAHYPAGGTISYETPTNDDRNFYDMIEDFYYSKAENREKLFKEMNDFGRAYIPKWSIYRIIQVLLNNINISLDEIIYFNAVPFRIPNNRAPKKTEIANAWNLYVEKMLDLFNPKIIACLGVATGKIFQSNYKGLSKVFVLRRRIGDNSIDPEVYIECEKIKKYYNQLLYSNS